MSDDRPDPIDRVLALTRPQRGRVPAELADPRNYLVFDRLPGADPAEPARAFATDTGGRPAIADPATVLGIVVGEVAPVTTAELATGTDPIGAPYIPDWTAVSALPTLAPDAGRPTITRRNGHRVRPEWVIPPDARSPYYPNTSPFTLVGRIFVWQDAAAPNWSWWGTASLLGARTILTAAHVVPWGAPNWKALFVPAYYDGASIHGSWAASWVTNAQGYAHHAQGDDMAVMRLQVPLGASLGYFGFRTYESRWQDLGVWTLPGYPWDKDSGNRPWLHLNFPIIDDDNDGAGVELEYRADTEGGQSGAPVFAWFDGKPYVVGTHSGGEDNVGEPRQNVAAGGNALTNLLQWARTTWP